MGLGLQPEMMRRAAAALRFVVMMGVAAGAGVAGAQTVAVSLPGPLLPQHFGSWTMTSSGAPAEEPAMSLANANKAALEECGPQRSQVATYVSGGRTLHVEAVQFGDYSGAWSAFTMVRTPGLVDEKALGTNEAAGGGAVLFTSGTVLVEAFPATQADVNTLKPLQQALPKAVGSTALGPILPLYLPKDALAPGSVRYALGAATYQAEGGVLPATALGWDKSAEAITAAYHDKRGEETLTLVMYPTPQIAEAYLKRIQALVPGMGPRFGTAETRRELDLVMLANGTFSAAAAQKMLAGIHMREYASTDGAMNPDAQFHVEVQQTVSLLTQIMIFTGVLAVAAVLLALFLGGGRAAIRVMRGKPAAVEPEFLSLHLAPDNPKVTFGETDKR